MAKARTTLKSARNVEPSVMGLPLKTWISSARRAKGGEVRSGSRAFLIALASRDSRAAKASLAQHLNKWQMTSLLQSETDSLHFQGAQGLAWIIRPASAQPAAPGSNDSLLQKSPYARMRDLAGSVVSQVVSQKVEKLVVEASGLSLEERRGLLVGLEMASYSLPQILLRGGEGEFSDQEIREASQLALSVNIARHLVNTPGGDLNPRTYAECIEALFASSATVTVDVLEGDRLVEERMNLLLAVGGAASEGPRLVHMRYRPKGVASTQRPIAIVGKGITFDSGGLDIKPSSGMRWMKKDMGGSAACAGIAKWAELMNLQVPLDIYLAMAENAIGSASFRPGDVITARSGLTVEIHNTDAEGRLVLADALDYAITQTGNDAPRAIINLATLTGAIKVGLGADIAGLFSNSDELANAITEAGVKTGEFSWRMPLFQPYKTLLRSTFADYSNASDGFAGAITAALFLEFFVGQVPWAHLDIYAWKDSADGAYSESGGNGQSVQMLASLLTRYAQEGAR
jgi:leucyl aminopeptidase